MSPTSVKSLAEKRVRRQKQFIAVGSVALLAILGFELPKVLGGGSSPQTAPAVTTAPSSSVGAAAAAGCARPAAQHRSGRGTA